MRVVCIFVACIRLDAKVRRRVATKGVVLGDFSGSADLYLRHKAGAADPAGNPLP